MKIEEVESRLALATADILKPRIAGFRVRVSVVNKNIVNKNKNGRKTRKDASVENWSPESGEIRIYFEPDINTPPAKLDLETPPEIVRVSGDEEKEAHVLPPEPLGDMIRALDRAESMPGYDFVALKWFRDTFLPAEGYAWTRSDSTRNNVLRDAIEKRLILTSKVPNPKSPEFPVTAIRLNRLLPETKAILQTPEMVGLEFKPVKIRGEALSDTILRERR